MLQGNRCHCHTAVSHEGTNEVRNAASELRRVINLCSLCEIYGYISYFYDYVLPEGQYYVGLGNTACRHVKMCSFE